jgi:hypothetical protein
LNQQCRVLVGAWLWVSSTVFQVDSSVVVRAKLILQRLKNRKTAISCRFCTRSYVKSASNGSDVPFQARSGQLLGVIFYIILENPTKSTSPSSASHSSSKPWQ